MEEKLIDNYTLIRKIGEGSFGEVYIASDNHGAYVAVKMEQKDKQQRLEIEYNILKYLGTVGCINIPAVYSYIETPKNNIMIVELLGLSIEDMFEKYNKKFELQTVFMIARQLIFTLYHVHRSSYIHRDIKPNNFLLSPDKTKLYIVDFGLSKKYFMKSPKNTEGTHIEFKMGRSLIGTARYASINMHIGIEPSRRDDMQSLGYMLVYLAKGSLPWQGLPKKDGISPITAIGQKKTSTSIATLCNGLPPCFEKYLNHCMELTFDETPNYKYLLSIFKEDSEEFGIPIKFEWT